jgi:hypothetical protein
MPRYHLFCLLAIPRLFNPANIQCPILPIEATHTSHIISVIRELVSRKAILGTIRHGIRRVGKRVSVFALPAVWTAATSKEYAHVLHPRGVGACEPRVAFDAASRLGFGFTE